MKLQAWLDGQPLNALDERIILREICEHAPKNRKVTLPALGGDGLRLVRLNRESLSVTLWVELHEPDPEKRQALLDRLLLPPGRTRTLNGAPLRQLKLSTRQNRLLECVVERTGDVMAVDWTRPVELRFTAWAIPYWQADELDLVELSGREDQGSLWLRGTAETVLEAAVLAQEPLNDVSLQCGGQMISLANLNMAEGELLMIGHDANGLMRIWVEGGGRKRSAYSCLEPWSADEIVLQPGENKPAFSADGRARVAIWGWGRWC